MKKITRTIKKYVVEITMYAYDSEVLETTVGYAYGMSSKELMRHFEKKYASVGKVKETENIKVSLAIVIPAVNESPEMPEPIVDGE